MNHWKTTTPPKRQNRPIKLRFRGPGTKILTGKFCWSDRENTWIECIAGDPLGLYSDDGWEILGWQE